MPAKRSFYFIRHGQTDWNKELRLQGSTDIPLNYSGHTQAAEAAKAVSDLPIDIIISSNLIRAAQTAEIINKTLNKSLIIDKGISERDYGDFEGLLISERDRLKKLALEENPNSLEETGFPMPKNSEPYPDFKKRIFSSINNHLDKHIDKNILFVAHGGVYRTIYRTIFKKNMQPKNAVPYRFEKTGEKWFLKTI